MLGHSLFTFLRAPRLRRRQSGLAAGPIGWEPSLAGVDAIRHQIRVLDSARASCRGKSWTLPLTTLHGLCSWITSDRLHIVGLAGAKVWLLVIAYHQVAAPIF